MKLGLRLVLNPRRRFAATAESRIRLPVEPARQAVGPHGRRIGRRIGAESPLWQHFCSETTSVILVGGLRFRGAASVRTIVAWPAGSNLVRSEDGRDGPTT
jgi:hypothetical protein